MFWFWLIISLWIAAVIVPAVYTLLQGNEYDRRIRIRYLLFWEAMMFFPLIAILGFIVLIFLSSMRGRRLLPDDKVNSGSSNNVRDLYIPKVNQDFYLPRWRDKE